MPEYIERETAIAWFMPYAHAGESIDADVVISDIKGMKAADVAPVRHGLWEARAIPRSDPDGDWIALEYHCSLCNRLEYRKENYCPHCGAKMDLED